MARRVLAIVLVIYLVGLLVFAFWPVHADTALADWLDGFVPSIKVGDVDLGSPTSLAAAVNFVLFIPLGLLTAASFGRGSGARWIAFGFCLAVAAGIEFVQGLFIAGRTASAYDLIAGAVGAAIGVLIIAIVAAAQKRSRRRAVATA